MGESIVNEPFDLYADAFTVTITPFGANLSFSLREAHPSAGKSQQSKPLGTVRMSVEHLKTMVWITRKQIRQVEAQQGVKAELSPIVLNQLGIPLDDWEKFWEPMGQA